MESILLIDDDKALGELLSRYFLQFNLKLSHALLPSLGLKQLSESTFSVVILDMMMPEMDGLAAFKEIRKISDVPVLMLTARGDVVDRVIGLELGMDDYLPKPFEPRELVARIRSLTRRKVNRENHLHFLVSGSLKVDLQSRKAFIEETDLDLTTHEFQLLKLFMQHPNQVLSRDRILDELRGIDWDAFNRSIDVAISRLRQKLNDSARDPKYLKTVWGDGYCFIQSVQEQK